MSSESVRASGCARISRARQVLQGVGGSAVAPGGGRVGGARRDVPAARDAGAALRRQGLCSPRSAPSDAEIEAYYKDPAHAAQFRAPEQASIEYVVLDLDALKKDIAVSEDDLRKYYAENEKRYTAPEERRAQPHPDQGRQGRAQGRAREGQGQGRGAARRGAQEPATFAEIARKNSDDEGSAAQGRRPRLLRPRRHGQAVRGRGVRA